MRSAVAVELVAAFAVPCIVVGVAVVAFVLVVLDVGVVGVRVDLLVFAVFSATS